MGCSTGSGGTTGLLKHPCRCRAFVQVDAIIAIAVVLLLSGVLAKSTIWSHRGADRLADARAAAALAEDALVDLAQGRVVPAGVTVEPTPGGTAVPGHRWVRVTAGVNGRMVVLVGLAKGDQ